MLASDLNNKEYVNPTDPDAALHVRFHKHLPLIDPAKMKYAEVEIDYIEIKTPGNDLLTIDRPVSEFDKARFRRQWKVYSEQGEGIVDGTPLTKWAILNKHQVMMLNSVGFFTVEQVAAASDQQITGVGMHAGMAPNAFRTQAQRFVMAQGGAAADAAQSEREAALQKRLDDQAKEMADMKAMLEKLTSPPKQETITVKPAKAA